MSVLKSGVLVRFGQGLYYRTKQTNILNSLEYEQDDEYTDLAIYLLAI